jgi:hypothetical protein
MAERILILAHQTEAMARQKRLKPVDWYLTPRRRRRPGPAQVATAMRRWERAGLNIRITRREPPKQEHR